MASSKRDLGEVARRLYLERSGRPDVDLLDLIYDLGAEIGARARNEALDELAKEVPLPGVERAVRRLKETQ